MSESHTLTRERGGEREGKSNLCNEGKGIKKRESASKEIPLGEVGETMSG